jgi:hypothetical protein
MYYQVFIDGVSCVGVRSMSGGACFSTVVVTDTHTSVHPSKRIGITRWEDVTVRFMAALDPGLVQWINDTWDGKAQGKSVRIVAIDPKGTTVWDRTLDHSYVSEVVVPGWGSKGLEPMGFAVSFTSASIVDNAGQQPAGGGSGSAGDLTLDFTAVTGTYTLALDGVGSTRPNRVEPISIKIDRASVPPVTAVSDVALTIGYQSAGPLLAWAKGFLGPTSGPRKEGTITCLDDHSQTVFTLKLHNVGANRYELAGDDDGSPVAKISLFCEDVDLEMGTASSGSNTGTSVTLEPGRKLDTTPKVIVTQPKGATRLTPGVAIGTARRLGPLEFTLKALDYTSSPLTVGGQQMTPSADQKLVVARYTVRNASNDAVKLTESSISFTATGASGATYTAFAIGLGAGMSKLSQAVLSPEDMLECSAVTTVPAKEDVVRLLVTYEGASADYNTAAKSAM